VPKLSNAEGSAIKWSWKINIYLERRQRIQLGLISAGSDQWEGCD